MKLRISLLLFCISVLLSAQAQKRKVFTTTPAYDEIIATYKKFAHDYPKLSKLEEAGTTDIGKPLHLFIISKNGKFDPASAKQKTVVMINNGIHPGEPDGIDASIELCRDLLAQPKLIPDSVILCIIPVYNVDGCLNRSNCSRANQCGPEQYGFRGNAKNLDLNRDFIKCDAQNTKSLEKIFQQWKPDVFIDTHVSDGADYQYVMTLIATQRSKLNPVVSGYMDNVMVPALYGAMKEKNYEMTPYVETLGETPESGIQGFLETPRFSTGYAALFNCMGFVTETHMWKPYNDRVWATYEFLSAAIRFCAKENKAIKKVHRDADNAVAMQKLFPLNWKLDTTKYEWFSFKGFEAKHRASEISGMQRMYYDRNAPYTKQVKFYNTYFPVVQETAPLMYVLPQAYTNVAERLQLNGVKMKRLKTDTMLRVEVYYIDNYETGKSPYESHYLHSDVKVHRDTQFINYYKGDYVIETNQPANRYIVETLEPEGGDSFFAWNFFDGVLQQKEWFSDYIFEEKADSLLKSDAALKKQFDEKKKSDAAFATDQWGQLNFIYQHSVYKEKTHDRYPVARLNEKVKLPLE